MAQEPEERHFMHVIDKYCGDILKGTIYGSLWEDAIIILYQVQFSNKRVIYLLTFMADWVIVMCILWLMKINVIAWCYSKII